MPVFFGGSTIRAGSNRRSPNMHPVKPQRISIVDEFRERDSVAGPGYNQHLDAPCIQCRDDHSSRGWDQRKMPPIDGLFVPLREFDAFKNAAAIVDVSNREAEGYVIVDAAQWIKTK